MRKTSLVAIAGASAVALLIAGCGSSDKKTTTGTSSGTKLGKVG